MKKVIKITAVILGLLLVIALIGGALIWNTLPRLEEDRLALPDGVVGIDTGASYAWLVPTENGVLLIDAGLDSEAQAIKAELEARGLSAADVHTILLTHGHTDHWGGAAAFPQATVTIHEADAHLFSGSNEEGNPVLSALGGLMFGDAVPPAAYETFSGEQVLQIDGETFEIFPVPGHSAGSIAILWHDILFLGDSAQKGESGLELPPEMFSENQEQIKASLATLLDLDFSVIAPAHSDVIEANGRDALQQFVQTK